MSGTPYSECYDAFLDYTDDIGLLNPYDTETEVEYQNRLDNTLFDYFRKAISKFFYSRTKLTRDDSQKVFLNVLRPTEIEIIGMLMLIEYYRYKMNFIAQFSLDFNDKDWKGSSKANQILQYRQLIKETSDEIDKLIKENALIDNSGELEFWNGE